MTRILPTAILGRTGIQVTRLGYGAMAVRNAEEHNANSILNSVLDSGINFIDTADDYGDSEELIGKSISHRRSEFYLATKCGGSPEGHIWTKEHVFKTMHDSLKRLKTDYIDIMQLHNTTVEECEQGDLVEALQGMRQQGKVRWIGVSTTVPHLPVYLKWGVFDEFQIPYSALQREHEDWITQAADAGIGCVIRGGVAQGEPDIGRGSAEIWQNFQKAELNDLTEDDESRTAFLLRFTLTHPQVHTTIVGTKNPEHLQQNVQAAMRGQLPKDVYDEAKRRLDNISSTDLSV